MSQLGTFLQNRLEHGDKGSFARRLHIDQGMLSRFLSGQRTSCNRKTLERMIEGIGPNPMLQAELLAAYLEDQLAGPDAARNLVSINVRGTSAIREEPPGNYSTAISDRGYTGLGDAVRAVGLDKKTLDSLTAIIRALPRSPELAQTVRSIGRLARALLRRK